MAAADGHRARNPRGAECGSYRRGGRFYIALGEPQQGQPGLRIAPVTARLTIRCFGCFVFATQAVDLALLVVRSAHGVDPRRGADGLSRLSSLANRPRPIALELEHLRPVNAARAGESRELRLRVAPRGQRGRPFASAVGCIHLLAATDHRAVHESRDRRQQATGRGEQHRFVQQREPLLPLAGRHPRLPLKHAAEAEEIFVVEALGGRDDLSRERQALDRIVVPNDGPIGFGNIEVATLDAVLTAPLDRTPGLGEPTRSATDLTDGQQAKPQPERRACCGRVRAALEALVKQALERREQLVAARQRARPAKALQVRVVERLRAIDTRERLERVAPVVSRVRGTGALELRGGGDLLRFRRWPHSVYPGWRGAGIVPHAAPVANAGVMRISSTDA